MKNISFIFLVVTYSFLLCVYAFFTNRFVTFSAENFSVLLLGAVESPLHIFTPLLDGYFLLSRAVVSLAAFLDIINIADVTMLICVVVHAYCGACLVREEYSWLIPSFTTRLLTSLLITCGPGAYEIVGNPICISYSATLMIIMLLLKSIKYYSIVDVFIFTICCFSTSVSPVFMPLSSLIVYRYRNKQGLLLFSILIITTLISVIRLHLLNVPVIRSELFLLDSISNVSILQIMKEIIARGTFDRSGITLIFYTAIGLISLICAIHIKNIKHKSIHNGEIAFGLILTSFTFCAIQTIFRSYGLGGFEDRHGLMIFAPIMLGLTTLWVSNFSSLYVKRQKYFAYENIFLALLIFLSLPANAKYYPDFRTQWINLVSCLRSQHSGRQTCMLDEAHTTELNCNNYCLQCNTEGNFNRCKVVDTFGQEHQYQFLITRFD